MTLMYRFNIFQVAQAITPNIIMFLPRNVDLHQVEELSWLSSPPLEVKVQASYLPDFNGVVEECPLRKMYSRVFSWYQDWHFHLLNFSFQW